MAVLCAAPARSAKDSSRVPVLANPRLAILVPSTVIESPCLRRDTGQAEYCVINFTFLVISPSDLDLVDVGTNNEVDIVDKRELLRCNLKI